MPSIMYDDVNLSLVPADAQAVAGYVNGRWANYPQVVSRFPKVQHLSIAVTAHADAQCLDIEPGDATNVDAPAWVKRQLVRGVHRPVLYCSVSNVAALLRVLGSQGISRGQIRLWTSHRDPRFGKHLCNPSCYPGMPTTADATQWTNRALGRSLDQSLCADGFFAAVPLPRPLPAPVPPPKPKRFIKGFGIRQVLSKGIWLTDVIRLFGRKKNGH